MNSQEKSPQKSLVSGRKRKIEFEGYEMGFELIRIILKMEELKKE